MSSRRSSWMVITDYHPAVGLIFAALAGALIGSALTGETPIPGVVEPDTVVRYGLPTARVLLDVSTLATVGASLLPLLIGLNQAERGKIVLRQARVTAVATSASWAVTALVSLALSTADLYPGETLTLDHLIDYVATVGSGQALVVSALVALAYFGFALLAVRYGESVPAELRVALAVFGLLPLPVTGHAANFGISWGGHGLSMASMELHVMAAAGWTGGLTALGVLVLANRELLAVALPRFSTLATLCLIIVGATGLLNALLTLYGTPGVDPVLGLFTTRYGWIVLGKVACYALLGLFGARIRFQILPLVCKRKSVPALSALLSVDVVVMGLAYGLAVVLTRAPVR